MWKTPAFVKMDGVVPSAMSKSSIQTSASLRALVSMRSARIVSAKALLHRQIHVLLNHVQEGRGCARQELVCAIQDLKGNLVEHV